MAHGFTKAPIWGAQFSCVAGSGPLAVELRPHSLPLEEREQGMAPQGRMWQEGAREQCRDPRTTTPLGPPGSRAPLGLQGQLLTEEQKQQPGSPSGSPGTDCR